MRVRSMLASFVALALPGPCTSFDDVPSPDAEVDASPDGNDGDLDTGLRPEDARPGNACDSGITFAFAADAQCQETVDRNCCIFEDQCASDPSCVKWVDCVNACPTPRTSACLQKCGPTRDASFGNELTGLSSCRNAFDGGALCVWP